MFLFKYSINFQYPGKYTSYIKATGKTIDGQKHPGVIEFNKKLTKNLLNTFWG
jgi:hypothetical protein